MTTSCCWGLKMPLPRLDNLVSIGKLKTEPPDKVELDGLLQSGARRLADAANETLAIESRFDLAYGAAHALATLSSTLPWSRP